MGLYRGRCVSCNGCGPFLSIVRTTIVVSTTLHIYIYTLTRATVIWGIDVLVAFVGMQLDTQAVNLHTRSIGGERQRRRKGAGGESLDRHTQVTVQDWLRSVMLWEPEMRRLPSRTHLRTSCVDLSWQIDLSWFPNVILQTKGWNKNSSTSRWTLRISRSYGRVLCDSGMVCFDISLCWKCGHITVIGERWHSISMSEVRKLRVEFKQKIIVQQNRPRVRRIGKRTCTLFRDLVCLFVCVCVCVCVCVVFSCAV